MLCALPSCASPGPPVLLRPDVPASLLTCAAEPPPPDLDAAGWDRALALWIVDLGAAGEDCRGRLSRLKELLAHE
jgi:hypothetical protein